jgi:hypothetical protein
MGGMGIRCRRAGGIGRDGLVFGWEGGFVGVAFGDVVFAWPNPSSLKSDMM